jgi:hypothetical protein
MSNDPRHPDFPAFSRWFARKVTAASPVAPNPAVLHAAAREARDEFLSTAHEHGARLSAARPKVGRLVTLTLLAAADHDASTRPPEMTTARGFKVTLAYDEGQTVGRSSICVLVQCPPELLTVVQGETAYLWNGSERFELGQFDADGKAIGTLPAGIEISLSDFAAGNVKLEEPDSPADE